MLGVHQLLQRLPTVKLVSQTYIVSIGTNCPRYVNEQVQSLMSST